VWFNLGDRDLAVGLRRAELLAGGARLTETLLELTRALGLGARVLPMSDDPVRTWVLAGGDWRPFQEFMILLRAQGPVEGVELRGAEAATAPPEVLDAIAGARAIVVGPSNPVISIGPILAVPGIREAIAGSPAPVVAVSPYVAGAVVKGPTDRFMEGIGRPTTAAGVASLYAGLIDAMVVDEGDPDPPPAEVPTLATQTLMEGAAGRVRLARIVLDYAATLGSA